MSKITIERTHPAVTLCTRIRPCQSYEVKYSAHSELSNDIKIELSKLKSKNILIFKYIQYSTIFWTSYNRIIYN